MMKSKTSIRGIKIPRKTDLLKPSSGSEETMVGFEVAGTGLGVG